MSERRVFRQPVTRACCSIALAGLIFAGAVCGHAEAESKASQPVVRIAELEIDPGQLDAYKGRLRKKSKPRFGWSLACSH